MTLDHSLASKVPFAAVGSDSFAILVFFTKTFSNPGFKAAFGEEKSTTSNENDLQTKKAWDQFQGGFFVGACGSAGFAFICLSSIPTFTTV